MSRRCRSTGMRESCSPGSTTQRHSATAVYTWLDNESSGNALLPASRAITLKLHEGTRTATLLAADGQPERLSAASQRNAQSTAGGSLFMPRAVPAQPRSLEPRPGDGASIAVPGRRLGSYKRSPRLRWSAGEQPGPACGVLAAPRTTAAGCNAWITRPRSASPPAYWRIHETHRVLLGLCSRCQLGVCPAGPHPTKAICLFLLFRALGARTQQKCEVQDRVSVQLVWGT